MDNGIYTDIGYTVVLCMKYIFIPIGVIVTSAMIVDRILRPRPLGRKNKRF